MNQEGVKDSKKEDKKERRRRGQVGVREDRMREEDKRGKDASILASVYKYFSTCMQVF